MTFNVSEFISEINSNGVQYNSDYDIIIPIPGVMLGKFQRRDGFSDVTFIEQAKILSMRSEAVNLPGVALSTTLTNRHGVGVIEKMPYSAGFTDTNISFVSDKNGNIPHFWYSWMNLITNFADTKELYGGNYKQYVCNYKDNYVSDISINKYDKGGNKISTIILRRAFPISIRESVLSWQDPNISKTDISINFKEWYYEGSAIALNEEG